MSNIHNFHFVLNGKLKEKIIILSKKIKMTKSATVIQILNETISILNRYHYGLEENTENLNYQKIDWNTNLHIYMDKNLYRKIKHLSDTIFSFSMGIVVRKLLELYFKILERNKGKTEKVKKVLKRFYKIKVKKYGNIQKNWNKIIKNEQLSGNFYYHLEFNDKFAITGFNFNNSF